MRDRRLDQALSEALLDLGIVGEVRAEIAGNVPALPSSEEGIEAGFFLAVYRYAQAWLIDRGGPVADAAPCVFVYSRSINQEARRLGASLVDYFKHLLEHDVCGGVYIATDDLTIVAKATCEPCPTAEVIGTTLRQFELGALLHVLFLPSRGELILCRSGLGGPTSLVNIELSAARRIETIDLERLIWRFHEQFTQTPSGTLLPWIGSPTCRIPVQELERRISGMLCFYLNATLGGDYVTTEHYTPHGRLDIKVAADVMVQGIGHCALELKVLRSRHHSNTNVRRYTTVSLNKMVDHATEGVMQAVDYRRQISAGVAYLCCFDARFHDEEQDQVLALADSNDVRLRRYFMYESPQAYRDAVLAAQRAGNLLSGQVD